MLRRSLVEAVVEKGEVLEEVKEEEILVENLTKKKQKCFCHQGEQGIRIISYCKVYKQVDLFLTK